MAELRSSECIQDEIDRVISFPDLRSAGCELALKLEAKRGNDDLVVLAIVLGGVLVAHEVAKWLRTPLDLVIIRRLLAPRGPGSQICAVNLGGTLVIDDEMPHPGKPATPLDHFLDNALEGLAQREQCCRGGRPPIDLARKTIILVDCGIRTGLTMQAAIGALRTRKPTRIIAAAPVAALNGRAAVEAIADEFVCLASPQPFGHVGLWYKDFNRPDDDRVSELLGNTQINDQ